MTKVRLSSHSFYIERGRWAKNKIDLKNRTCTLCGVVEDEYHCLIECPRFYTERKGSLSDSFLKKPSMFKFINLFNSVVKS